MTRTLSKKCNFLPKKGLQSNKSSISMRAILKAKLTLLKVVKRQRVLAQGITKEVATKWWAAIWKFHHRAKVLNHTIAPPSGILKFLAKATISWLRRLQIQGKWIWLVKVTHQWLIKKKRRTTREEPGELKVVMERMVQIWNKLLVTLQISSITTTSITTSSMTLQKHLTNSWCSKTLMGTESLLLLLR
jgi:hypothetical protein